MRHTRHLNLNESACAVAQPLARGRLSLYIHNIVLLLRRASLYAIMRTHATYMVLYLCHTRDRALKPRCRNVSKPCVFPERCAIPPARVQLTGIGRIDRPRGSLDGASVP